MMPENFILTIQHKVAVTAIGPSALRGQGAGVLGTSQGFLKALSLTRLPKSSQWRFRKWLDRQTAFLLDELPVTGRPWGAARKALNLFLRDALYNRYLSHKFGLSGIEMWLEIPLDSAVAKGLKFEAGRGALPPWPGLKRLTPDISQEFQEFASNWARDRKISRVHLDMYLWLENR